MPSLFGSHRYRHHELVQTSPHVSHSLLPSLSQTGTLWRQRSLRRQRRPLTRSLSKNSCSAAQYARLPFQRCTNQRKTIKASTAAPATKMALFRRYGSVNARMSLARSICKTAVRLLPRPSLTRHHLNNHSRAVPSERTPTACNMSQMPSRQWR